MIAQILPTAADASEPGSDLIAPGAPYELETAVIAGVETRLFRHAPQTLTDAYRALVDYDARVFTVFEGGSVSYRETLHKAAALAQFVRDRQLARAGTRVAIAMHNCPEWTIAFIAITSIGATAVLVNNRSTVAELASALAETAVELVIADQPCAQRIAKTGLALPRIVKENEPRPSPSAAFAFADAVAGWEAAVFDPAPVHPEAEALVMFTSGTTGASKGVLLSHRSVLAGVMNIQYSMRVIGERIKAERRLPTLGQQPPPAALLAVPLFHTSGCYSIFLSNLLRGGKIVMLRKWHAERALGLIEQERVSAFSGPPSMLWDLVRARRDGRDLRSLTSIGVAGQELRPQLLHEIVAAFPQAVLGRGYGMTEANGSVCLIAGDELLRHPSSSGRVIATVDIKLIDEHGGDVAAGGIGEICLRGAAVMLGYCNRPKDTAAVLRDGWLHTGDLGRLDADGYLHIIDRKKNIIISGGDKISCSEVERVALEHPAVIDAAVFGVADDRLGEIPGIAVVLKPDCLVDSFALKSHIASQLAIYKVPRLIMYCNRLPCNTLGKVNRHELRRQFMALHPRYRIDADETTSMPPAYPTQRNPTAV